MELKQRVKEILLSMIGWIFIAFLLLIAATPLYAQAAEIDSTPTAKTDWYDGIVNYIVDADTEEPEEPEEPEDPDVNVLEKISDELSHIRDEIREIKEVIVIVCGLILGVLIGIFVWDGLRI